MRVLYYNWVDYLDAEGRGGGVSLYQRNVMAELAKDPTTEPVFLASGVAYDLPARAPRWEPIRDNLQVDGVARYDLVNSGVLAPAHYSFGDHAQLSHPATRDAFFDFIEKTGPYDVIHFNNLEGLPADVLELSLRWPQTQIVLSLHNYYPICPQVNLWFEERKTCEDFEDGAACVQCLPHQYDGRMLRVMSGMSCRLKSIGLQPGTWAFDVAFRWFLRLARRGLHGWRWISSKLRKAPAKTPLLDPNIGAVRAAEFANRRAQMIALINTHCTHVLCVSDAVRVLAERYGISASLTRTNYIGTLAAEMFPHTTAAKWDQGKETLTLGFLGYMRRDKGFFFLLDALEALPPEQAARVRVVIAARAGPRDVMDRIDALKSRLADIIYYDGYTHEQLDDILSQVDVGVVPVLWHDNLPQVAIEMHARHIPLLTSHMGGAPELGRCADMVFTAGDTDSFGKRIDALLAGLVDMDSYWSGAMVPLTMAAHIAELSEIYATRPQT